MTKKYVSYLFFTTIKRSFFYILPVVFMFLSTIISLPQIFSANANSRNSGISNGFFNSINYFFLWFVFVISSIFFTMLVIHAFKRQEESGIELLIVAKKITRMRIILGKVIYILICNTIFLLVSTLWIFILSTFDKETAASTKALNISSIFIGGLIISFLFGSLILLMSSFMSKIGTIVISILISVFVFIFHAAVIPTTNAINPIRGYDSAEGSPKFNADGTYSISKIYGKSENNDQYDAVKANNASAYGYLKFIDFWGQWGNLYTTLSPDSSSEQTTGFFKATKVNYRSVSQNDLDNIFMNINIDDNSIAYRQFDIDNIGNLAKIDQLKQSNFDEYVNNALQAPKTDPNLKILDLKEYWTTLSNIKNYIIKNDLTSLSEDEVSKINSVLYYKIANSLFNKHKDIKFSSDQVTTNFEEDKKNNTNIYSRNYALSNEKGYIIVTSLSSFLNPKIVIPIWSIIAVGLSVAVVWIYLRRDFK